MADPYQRGPDEEWLKHSNEELARMIKNRDRQLRLLRFLSVILLILLAWVVYKFARKSPLAELWTF